MQKIVSYYDLDENQQDKIDKENNDTLPQGTTWFFDSEGKLYQVENNLLELHSQQSPNDIKVIFE